MLSPVWLFCWLNKYIYLKIDHFLSYWKLWPAGSSFQTCRVSTVYWPTGFTFAGSQAHTLTYRTLFCLPWPVTVDILSLYLICTDSVSLWNLSSAAFKKMAQHPVQQLTHVFIQVHSLVSCQILDAGLIDWLLVCNTLTFLTNPDLQSTAFILFVIDIRTLSYCQHCNKQKCSQLQNSALF